MLTENMIKLRELMQNYENVSTTRKTDLKYKKPLIFQLNTLIFLLMRRHFYCVIIDHVDFSAIPSCYCNLKVIFETEYLWGLYWIPSEPDGFRPDA